MIQIIKELLLNAQLKQQVKEAANLIEAIQLITLAGVEKGYSLTQENVAQAISGLMLGEQELSEEDLQVVAGGLRCHDSCVLTDGGGGGDPNTMYTGLSTTFFNCCDLC